MVSIGVGLMVGLLEIFTCSDQIEHKISAGDEVMWGHWRPSTVMNSESAMLASNNAFLPFVGIGNPSP